MTGAFRLSILMLTFALCGGCSDGCSKSSTSPSGTGPAVLSFQASPISVSAVRYIMPLGHLTPSVFSTALPERFIYFYFANPDAGESPTTQQTVVFAPSGGTVIGVFGSQMQVRATDSMMYYLTDFVPDAQVVAGQSISAGQRVGVTGSSPAVTLQLMNYSGSPALSNVTSYEPPLKYFDEPVRSQLYGRVQRLGTDLDGRFDYDVAGRLSGTWYLEATLLPYPLCFAYDTYDPSQPRLSLGDPTGTAGVFAVGSGDPDPGSVSVTSGLVRYTLTKSRTGLPLNGGPGGTLLVQMLTDRTIRAEWLADGTSASSFTANARTFVRGPFCSLKPLPPC